MTALWFTDFWHGLNPSIPALLAAVLPASPQVGGPFLEGAGAEHLLVHFLRARRLPFYGQRPPFPRSIFLFQGLNSAVILLLILLVTVVHLEIAKMSACIALLIPITTTLAASLQMNPVVFGLIVGIVVDAVILYPVQTATNLLAYETGLIQGKDVLKVGLGMLVITSAVILLIALPWWSLLELPLKK